MCIGYAQASALVQASVEMTNASVVSPRDLWIQNLGRQKTFLILFPSCLNSNLWDVNSRVSIVKMHVNLQTVLNSTKHVATNS